MSAFFALRGVDLARRDARIFKFNLLYLGTARWIGAARGAITTFWLSYLIVTLWLMMSELGRFLAGRRPAGRGRSRARWLESVVIHAPDTASS